MCVCLCPSHHWWMANEEANGESCKCTCDLPPSEMARWLSHKPPMQTRHANMITWHYMISSHLISTSPFRVYPSVSSHAPGSLIKCRGSLVVRLAGIPDYSHKHPDFAQASRILHQKQNFSEFTRHDVARSKIRTSIQISNKHPEFSIRSRISQNSPDYMFRIRQKYRLFHPSEFPVSSMIHVHLAVMSKPSTEINSTMPLPAFFVGRWLLAEQPDFFMQWFAFVSLLQWKLNWTPWNFLGFLFGASKTPHLIGDTHETCTVHRDLSTTFHVTTQHWGKQHHAVTSLFCRSLVACWTAGNSDAVVCFCQPSSVEISLNAAKLPRVFVGASKTPHLIGDTHDPCTQRFEHHVPCYNPATRETAPCRYQPCLSVVGCLLNSRKFWCSGLLLSAFSVELALNAVKLPLVFCWRKQHNVTDIWALCSMSQHNTVENSTLD